MLGTPFFIKTITGVENEVAAGWCAEDERCAPAKPHVRYLSSPPFPALRWGGALAHSGCSKVAFHSSCCYSVPATSTSIQGMAGFGYGFAVILTHLPTTQFLPLVLRRFLLPIQHPDNTVNFTTLTSWTER